MDKQLGICDICEAPVYEHGDYIKVCGTYAHAKCAQDYGEEDLTPNTEREQESTSSNLHPIFDGICKSFFGEG